MNAPADSPRNNGDFKPFLEHLEDLRWTLIRCMIALAAGMAVALPLAPRILGWLMAPLAGVTEDTDRFLGSLEVVGAFTVALRIAFWSGILLAAPFILLFVGAFIFPGLTLREKRMVRRAAGAGFVLFFLGVLMGYFVMLPVALKVMFGFHQWLGIRAQWVVTSYVVFATQTLAAFGLAFELPVVVLVLGGLGVLTSAQLRDKRRHVIVVLLIVAAVLTPPDVFSQLIMAVPLYLLYESCIWIVRAMERRAAGSR